MKRIVPAVLCLTFAMLAWPSRAQAQSNNNLQAALQSLQRAEQQLNQASTPDASGYRQRTLELVQQAEQSLQQLMGYDAHNSNQPTASRSTLNPSKGQQQKAKPTPNGVSKNAQ